MDSFKSGALNSNGIEIHYEEKGEGPLVIFCHGWPESWYSWRHQLNMIGSNGYRAVALHMRGYGRSTKPENIEAYSITNLVGDVVGVVEALGASEAVVVGHDWGGPIALNTAALYPDRIRATGTMSVTYMGRGPMPLLDLWKEIYKDKFFYQLFDLLYLS